VQQTGTADGAGVFAFTANALSDGSHTLGVRATDAAGNSALETIGVLIDTVPPTATFPSAQSPEFGATVFDFTVTYGDSRSLLELSSLGDDDITIIGPDNTHYAATLMDTGIGGGTSRTVTYRMMPPGGGTWDSDDSGAYSVVQNENAVADIAGNFRPAGTIGAFNLNTPFAHLEGSALHVDFTSAGNDVLLTVNGGNLDVTQDGSTLSFADASFDSVVVHGTSGDDVLHFIGPLAQPITFSGGAGNDQLNVLGGTFTFAHDARVDADNLGVRVADGATAIFDATQHLRDLDVDGTATLTQGGAKVIVTRGLSGAGRLDLTDNDLVLDYDAGDPNPLAAIEARIAAGYNFSAWDGNGIVTSMPDATGGLATLAITDPAALFGMGPTETMEFSGETVDGSSVLIKYTWAGDLNLDGVVDAGDYGVIDNYFQFPGSSGYANGDFNFDGVIDAGDYGIIDNSFQLQGPPL
jgi:hypothetical protein